MKFKELIKNNNVLKVLDEMNYETPTKIQEDIIPLILDGNDVLGQSQTGTGKTIAFALPIIEKINANRKTQAIILAPTRELAIQNEREFVKLTKYSDIKTLSVYGSSSIEEQIKALKKGCEIVVGTPGRVKDLIKRRVLNLSEINYFVLDEADEMLSMGFQEEIEFIFDKVNNDRQVLLFSATMPNNILKIAKTYMASDYKMISISSIDETPKNVCQEYYLVNSKMRLESLSRIIDYYNPNKCMIFCRTKRNADEVLDKLLSKGYSANVIHGDITQSQRIQTLDQFKAGVFNYLIATDVAARGIHVDDVNIVVNYNLPESDEAYVHRVGRTGRASKTGLALSLIEPKEEFIIRNIEKKVKSKIEKKDIPTKEEIFKKRVDIIIDESKELIDSNKDTSLFTDYLNSLDNNDMKNMLAQLLLKELNNSVGSDFSTNVNETSKRKKDSRRNNDTSTRLFLTIGKIDNIEKRELLCFLEKKANLKEGAFSHMEMLSKFSFVDIDNKYLDKVLAKCNNTEYKNRTIRIEIANK